MTNEAVQQPETTDPLTSLREEFANSILTDADQKGFGAKAIERLMSPKLLIPLAIGGTTVAAFIPGVVEGLSQGRPFFEAVRYSLTSTPLSTIWDSNPEGPWQQIVEKYMLALRATIIPAITGGSVVGGFLYLYDRAKRSGEAILFGRAPIKRYTPQVFALFGEESYAADVFYGAISDHVIPIVERPEAMRRVLSGSEHRGTFVTIPNAEYGVNGKKSPWDQLKITKDWLIPTKQGNFLLIYGFGETKDEELPLTPEPLVDLTVEELAIAARKIEDRAAESGVQPDRVVKIYLGNPERRRTRGTASGLKQVTDREVAEGTIDIYVDAGRTIAQALKEKIGKGATIGFETGVPNYWEGMKSLAEQVGLSMHDEKNPDPGNAVLLVYEQHTDESVQSAVDMKRKNPGRRVIVLTSSLNSHVQALNTGVESLCVSEILTRELFDIQRRLVEGETPEKIQSSLR